MRRIRDILGDARGATAVEYGLICALIVVVMLVGLANMSGSVVRLYSTISNNTRNVM
jgi:pilus assembly protein Flp/PilA